MTTPRQPRTVGRQWRSRLLATVAGITTLAASSPAVAAGTAMPWDGPLERIVDNLTGPFALAVGVLGLVVLAVRILFGEQFGQFAPFDHQRHHCRCDDHRRRRPAQSAHSERQRRILFDRRTCRRPIRSRPVIER